MVAQRPVEPLARVRIPLATPEILPFGQYLDIIKYMNWLNPKNIDGRKIDYPQRAVDSFIQEEGEIGRLVLNIFNQENPLNCYDETIPDEYLGYVKRIIKKLKPFLTRPQTLSFDIVYSCVRDGFHSEQVEKEFVTEDKIKYIAENIFQQLIQLLKSKNTSVT